MNSKPNQTDVAAALAAAAAQLETPTPTAAPPSDKGATLSRVLMPALGHYANALAETESCKVIGLTADQIDLNAGPMTTFYADVVTELAGELRNLSRAVSRALSIVESVTPPTHGKDGELIPSDVLDLIGDMVTVYGAKGATAARFSLPVVDDEGKAVTTVSYRLPAGTPMGNAFKSHGKFEGTARASGQELARKREAIKTNVALGLWTTEQGAAELAKLEFGS